MPSLPKSRYIADCFSCEYRALRTFCNLAPEALEKFASIGSESAFPKGAVLFGEDEPSRYIFVLCTGQVKLSCDSKDGRRLILKIAMPGDVLGLSAVMSGCPYEVSAETIEPAQVKQIRSTDFLKFLESHGQASVHAAKALSAEYKSAFVDARRLALSGSAAGKLGSLLLEWGIAARCAQSEMRFTMALTHDELACMAGTSRETVTRTLARFQKDKLIEIRGSSILIIAPDGLEALSA